MTTNCELCGRGTVQKALTPWWFPHDVVCDRARCRAAARDAVESIITTRESNHDLVAAIGERAEEYQTPLPVGWRGDAMAKIDVVDDEEWWANSIVKRTA